MGQRSTDERSATDSASHILHRSSDAALTLCQNNTEKSILVLDINEKAREMLGLTETPALPMAFSALLPARISAVLDEYLDYTSDGQDVAEVIHKIRDFQLVGKGGAPIECQVKLVRIESSDGHARFAMVLYTPLISREKDALRETLQSYLMGDVSRDEATGMPDKYALQSMLDMLNSYILNNHLQACYAVLIVNHLEDQPLDFATQEGASFISHLAGICRRTLRGNDVVGRVSLSMLGMVLLDVDIANAQMVLNRLRWVIASQAGQGQDYRFPVSVSIGYMPIDPHRSSDLVDYATEFMIACPRESANHMLLIPPTDRRVARQDRRQRQEDWGERDRRKTKRR